MSRSPVFGVVFLRDIRNLELHGFDRRGCHPATRYSTGFASPIPSLGISMDASGFRLCRFRDFCKPVATQACAIVRRVGDYLAGNPVLHYWRRRNETSSRLVEI